MDSIPFLGILYLFHWVFTNSPLDTEHCIYPCAKKILGIIKEYEMEEKLIKASKHLWKSFLNSRKMSLLAFEVIVFVPILGIYLLFHQ